MAATFTHAEMKENLLQIINERDQLRIELTHAKSAIIELEDQNLEYDGLLSNAVSQIQACKSKKPWSQMGTFNEGFVKIT